jgi:hypothetical protein
LDFEKYMCESKREREGGCCGDFRCVNIVNRERGETEIEYMYECMYVCMYTSAILKKEEMDSKAAAVTPVMTSLPQPFKPSNGCMPCF